MKNINNVFIAPYMTYTDGNGGYWLNGKNIALNAVSYKVEDEELFDIFDLKIDNNVSIIENERIISANGEAFETIEEFLELTYNLKNLEQETNLIICFCNN